MDSAKHTSLLFMLTSGIAHLTIAQIEGAAFDSKLSGGHMLVLMLIQRTCSAALAFLPQALESRLIVDLFTGIFSCLKRWRSIARHVASCFGLCLGAGGIGSDDIV